MQLPVRQEETAKVGDKRLLQIGGLTALLIGIVSLVASNLVNALTSNISEPVFEGLSTPQADMTKFLDEFSQNPAPFVEMDYSFYRDARRHSIVSGALQFASRNFPELRLDRGSVWDPVGINSSDILGVAV